MPKSLIYLCLCVDVCARVEKSRIVSHRRFLFENVGAVQSALLNGNKKLIQSFLFV